MSEWSSALVETSWSSLPVDPQWQPSVASGSYAASPVAPVSASASCAFSISRMEESFVVGLSSVSATYHVSHSLNFSCTASAVAVVSSQVCKVVSVDVSADALASALCRTVRGFSALSLFGATVVAACQVARTFAPAPVCGVGVGASCDYMFTPHSEEGSYSYSAHADASVSCLSAVARSYSVSSVVNINVGASVAVPVSYVVDATCAVELGASAFYHYSAPEAEMGIDSIVSLQFGASSIYAVARSFKSHTLIVPSLSSLRERVYRYVCFVHGKASVCSDIALIRNLPPHVCSAACGAACTYSLRNVRSFSHVASALVAARHDVSVGIASYPVLAPSLGGWCETSVVKARAFSAPLVSSVASRVNISRAASSVAGVSVGASCASSFRTARDIRPVAGVTMGGGSVVTRARVYVGGARARVSGAYRRTRTVCRVGTSYVAARAAGRTSRGRTAACSASLSVAAQAQACRAHAVAVACGAEVQGGALVARSFAPAVQARLAASCSARLGLGVAVPSAALLLAPGRVTVSFAETYEVVLLTSHVASGILFPASLIATSLHVDSSRPESIGLDAGICTQITFDSRTTQ